MTPVVITLGYEYDRQGHTKISSVICIREKQENNSKLLCSISNPLLDIPTQRCPFGYNVLIAQGFLSPRVFVILPHKKSVSFSGHKNDQKPVIY